MTTVGVVVVTFNRKKLLIECLDALLNQTRKIDKIFVIDNASSDGTQILIEEKAYHKYPQIDYRLMSENLGGAGGFHEGIKAAYEAGLDWIWVMDDDAEPHTDTLSKLEANFKNPSAVAVCPVITDGIGIVEENSHHRGWFVPYKNDNIVRGVNISDMTGKSYLEIDHCSFVGLCFCSSIVTDIGLPKAEFFIHYDDAEFCTRLNKIGKMYLVTNSYIKHKEAAKIGLIENRSTLWRSSHRVAYEKLWLQFYGYRNRTWMIVNKKIKGSYFSLLITHFRKIAGVILYDDNKIRRLVFWNSAFVDGLKGDFDNAKPRRILNK